MQAIGRSARMARHHKRHKAAEINLVSMIDMLTILVFFLLVHGGFVRLAILELNLPTAQSQASEEPPEFQLEVTVRETRHRGRRSRNGSAEPHRQDRRRLSPRQLTSYLSKVKQQFPEKTDATLLLEPDISYDIARRRHGPHARDRAHRRERRPARARRPIPRDLDRRRAGAELRPAAVKFMGRAARMARHHKRAKAEGEINLVSMIDMLTVLVFFLLVYSSQEIEILPPAKDVQLPAVDGRAERARRRRRHHLGKRDPHGRAESRPDLGYPDEPRA